MKVFVDTSAFYALVDKADDFHGDAVDCLAHARHESILLMTHDYVLVETTALIQSRLGMAQVALLHGSIFPAVEVVSVSPAVRHSAVASLLAAGRKAFSLVDWVSFEIMRDAQIDSYFGFDDDFLDQGFIPLTPP